MPKASAPRFGTAAFVAPVLLAVHRGIGPLRTLIDALVIAPLSRLTAPSAKPRDLNQEELAAMLDLSAQEGVIDDLEQSLLQEVIRMRRLRVADVMTPRVSMSAITRDSDRREIEHLAERTHLSEVPVRAQGAGTVKELCSVRSYLLDPRGSAARLADPSIRLDSFPSFPSLEHLLDHFRRTRPVPRWSSTSGDCRSRDHRGPRGGAGRRYVGLGEESIPPERLEDGSWRVSGAMRLDEWSAQFGAGVLPERVRTVGGLFMDLLGREPRDGDEITLGNLLCSVESCDGGRVRTALVRVVEDVDGGADS